MTSRIPGTSIAGAGVIACVFALTTAAQQGARAPADTLLSDRPGLGDGAWVLAPGVWQAELGLTLRDTGPQRLGDGTALLRAGLSDLELRLYLPTPSYQPDGNETEIGDLGAGFKLPLSRGNNWTWSLVGGFYFPTGSSGATADESSGFATLVAETSLSDRIGFALNAGGSTSFESGDGDSFSLIPTFSVSLAEDLSAYAGYAGFYADNGDQHWVEAGVAVGVTADLQWDINTGYDMENDSWFLGVGFSRRWR